MELLENVRNPPFREDKPTRNWVFILYPEESCKNWLWEVQMLHVPTLISPLHNPAFNGKDDDSEDDESQGKVHHHVMFAYHGSKTYRSVQDVIAYLRYRGVACTYAQKVSDKIAMEEYFFHIGYPRKQQFPTLDDCAQLNGYKMKVQDLDSSQVMTEIVNYIRLTGEQFNYASIMEYAIDNQPHWVSTIVSKSYAIQTLLRSYQIYGGANERRLAGSKENIKIEQRVRSSGTYLTERMEETHLPQIR